MRRFPAVLAALTLAATGCSFSSVDPNAQVDISGRVLDASGTPLAGANVLLFKQADIGEVVFGSILAIGTLSTICFLPDPPALCRSAKTTKADGDGRYTFRLDGSDTQGTLGTESTLNVVFSGPADQGSTTVSFTAKKESISLPDARLWNARARATAGAGGIRLAWSPLPGGAGSSPAFSAQAFESGSESALWSQPAEGKQATIDPRILENGAGAVAVGARTKLSGGSGAGSVSAHYLSKRVKVRSSAGKPPSRGAKCASVTGTAPAKNGTFSRCAATDGNLTEPARLTGRGDALVAGVVVDLGRARPVDLVVARGFAGQVVLEISTDGKSFQTVATNSGTVAISVPGRPSARFVRLRSPVGLDESLMTEISVW